MNNLTWEDKIIAKALSEALKKRNIQAASLESRLCLVKEELDVLNREYNNIMGFVSEAPVRKVKG